MHHDCLRSALRSGLNRTLGRLETSAGVGNETGGRLINDLRCHAPEVNQRGSRVNR